MSCMDHILRRYIEETQHEGQIISFGAGFDTTYFRLKEAFGLDIHFVEVNICIKLLYMHEKSKIPFFYMLYAYIL